jgi:hypothetical protein
MTEDDLAAIEGMLSAGAIEVRYGREYDPSIVRALVAEVRRLREERRGMVAESSWDQLADEMTEVEADNARLRDAILSHMDASYDPPSVADMALWAHIMDQDATQARTYSPHGDGAARG